MKREQAYENLHPTCCYFNYYSFVRSLPGFLEGASLKNSSVLVFQSPKPISLCSPRVVLSTQQMLRSVGRTEATGLPSQNLMTSNPRYLSPPTRERLAGQSGQKRSKDWLPPEAFPRCDGSRPSRNGDAQGSTLPFLPLWGG